MTSAVPGTCTPVPTTNINNAPKVNKIEIQEKEVTPPENYLKEEEFLSILKEFRLSLE